MNIQVHQHQLLHITLVQQHSGGDSAIVEDAESTAKSRMSVVGSSGQVGRQPVLQGQSCCEQRSADGEPGALNQRFGCGKTDPSLLRTCELV